LLCGDHPRPVLTAQVVGQLDRRNPAGVRNELQRLWQDKMAEGDAWSGYRLMASGPVAAVRTTQRGTNTAA
jgi:hypothetical protein